MFIICKEGGVVKCCGGIFLEVVNMWGFCIIFVWLCFLVDD